MHVRRIMALAPMLLLGALASCSTQDEAVAPGTLSPAFGKNTCDPKKQDCILLGRMTGGGNAVSIDGVKITKGLTLHCDILLSNNLEVNWPDGNNWHLTKPIETADCVDDPAIDPEPPPAPFDTFIGTATGSLNGVEGSYIEFIFVDAGEPGGKNDMVELKIHTGDASTPLALDLPLQFTTGGNLQAHFDQPHK
jgi:hypothetical protein